LKINTFIFCNAYDKNRKKVPEALPLDKEIGLPIPINFKEVEQIFHSSALFLEQNIISLYAFGIQSL
jgi:hypothetical protein